MTEICKFHHPCLFFNNRHHHIRLSLLFLMVMFLATARLKSNLIKVPQAKRETTSGPQKMNLIQGEQYIASKRKAMSIAQLGKIHQYNRFSTQQKKTETTIYCLSIDTPFGNWPQFVQFKHFRFFPFFGFYYFPYVFTFGEHLIFFPIAMKEIIP